MVNPTEQQQQTQQNSDMPAHMQFAREQMERQYQAPSAAEHLEAAHTFENMAQTFAGRAESTSRELTALNEAYQRQPKPGGVAKTAAIAGVGALGGRIVGGKIVDAASNFKNADIQAEKAADIIGKIRDTEGAKKALESIGKQFGEDSALTQAASEHIQNLTEAATTKADYKDFAKQLSGEMFADAAKQDATQGIVGRVTNGIRDSQFMQQHGGKVTGTVVAITTVGGTLLAVNHIQKENAVRQDRLDQVQAMIDQKGAERRTWTDRASQANGLSQQARELGSWAQAVESQKGQQQVAVGVGV